MAVGEFTQKQALTYKPQKWAAPQDFVDRWPFQKRHYAMWIEGMKWYARWRDQSKYLNPTRGFFYNGIPNYGPPLDHGSLIDSHVRRCIRDFACGMTSGMTSPSRPWFKFEIEDSELMKFQPVKVYFEQVEKIMMNIASHSNLYDGFFNDYEELVTFGTSSMALLEDYQDVIRARNYTIGEYFLGTGPDNRVNAFTRAYWMTVSKLIEEFGEENCSPQVVQMYYNNQSDAWRRIIQLVEVNDDRIPEYDDFANKAVRSIYWEDGSMQNMYLRLEGFNEFPVLSTRWQPRTTADIYGNGPGADFLGDVKMLQMMQKKKLIGLDKVVDPPLQADAAVGNVNTMPGGITRFSSAAPNAGVRPTYQVQIDLNAIREDILEVKQAANSAFFADLFKMMIGDTRPGVTAYEIAERKAEQLNMLSPIVEKLNNERNNPCLTRFYNICQRNRLFPPLPKELKGQKLQIKYISVLAQAQRMAGLSAIQQTVAFFGANAQLFPTMQDNLNLDNVAQGFIEDIGLPPSYANDPLMVQKIRKIKADQMAQAQQQQSQMAQAEAMAKGGAAVKSMGDTPMGTGSALDALLGGLGNATGIPK